MQFQSTVRFFGFLDKRANMRWRK